MSKHRLIAAAVAVLGLAALPAAASASGGGGLVKVEDRCDPASFDAVLGPGSCAPADGRGGQVTFDELIEELTEKREHDGWRFDRDKVKLDRGESLTARMTRGGEFHTFAPVARFGPGCVPELNAPVFAGQDQTPIAECDDPANFGRFGIVPGAELRFESLARGTHRFMCLDPPVDEDHGRGALTGMPRTARAGGL